jgi:FkbM family methyltransferase
LIIRAKTIIARLACSSLVGKLISRVLRDRIPHRGCTIDTRSDSISPVSKASLFWGFYESAETRFVQQFLRSDLDVIELGSSLGVVASHIAKKLAPGRRLVCVEANPNLLQAISRNVRINQPAIELELVHGALSYSPRDAGFVNFSCKADHTTSRVQSETTADPSIRVPSVTLSKIVERYQIDQFALVCDIEGAEADLIANESTALRKCMQIVIELHANGGIERLITVKQLIDKLQTLHGFALQERYGDVCVFARSNPSYTGSESHK